jgi:hypothetical protein
MNPNPPMATANGPGGNPSEMPGSPDRREFLRSVGRYATAGALGGLTLMAIAKSSAACRRPLACGQCPVYGGCDLPKATNYRAIATPAPRSRGPAASGSGGEVER